MVRVMFLKGRIEEYRNWMCWYQLGLVVWVHGEEKVIINRKHEYSKYLPQEPTNQNRCCLSVISLAVPLNARL